MVIYHIDNVLFSIRLTGLPYALTFENKAILIFFNILNQYCGIFVRCQSRLNLVNKYHPALVALRRDEIGYTALFDSLKVAISDAANCGNCPTEIPSLLTNARLDHWIIAHFLPLGVRSDYSKNTGGINRQGFCD